MVFTRRDRHIANLTRHNESITLVFQQVREAILWSSSRYFLIFCLCFVCSSSRSSRSVPLGDSDAGSDTLTEHELLSELPNFSFGMCRGSDSRAKYDCMLIADVDVDVELQLFSGETIWCKIGKCPQNAHFTDSSATYSLHGQIVQFNLMSLLPSFIFASNILNLNVIRYIVTMDPRKLLPYNLAYRRRRLYPYKCAMAKLLMVACLSPESCLKGNRHDQIILIFNAWMEISYVN